MGVFQTLLAGKTAHPPMAGPACAAADEASSAPSSIATAQRRIVTKALAILVLPPLQRSRRIRGKQEEGQDRESDTHHKVALGRSEVDPAGSRMKNWRSRGERP